MSVIVLFAHGLQSSQGPTAAVCQCSYQRNYSSALMANSKISSIQLVVIDQRKREHPRCCSCFIYLFYMAHPASVSSQTCDWLWRKYTIDYLVIWLCEVRRKSFLPDAPRRLQPSRAIREHLWFKYYVCLRLNWNQRQSKLQSDVRTFGQIKQTSKPNWMRYRYELHVIQSDEVVRAVVLSRYLMPTYIQKWYLPKCDFTMSLPLTSQEANGAQCALEIFGNNGITSWTLSEHDADRCLENFVLTFRVRLVLTNWRFSVPTKIPLNADLMCGVGGMLRESRSDRETLKQS